MGRALVNIRIRGTTYWFRRRVPSALVSLAGQTELVRSLRTSSAREARRRATILWTETDRAFDAMTKQSLAAEQVAAILRRLREEPLWDSPTGDELTREWRDNDEMPLQNLLKLGPDQIRALPEAERRHLFEHLGQLARQVEMDELVIDRDFARAEAMIAQRQAAAADGRAADAERTAYVAVGMAAAATGGAAGGADRTVAPKPSPTFFEHVEAFLADKQTKDDDGRAYTQQTVQQVRASFRLLVEFVGDKPLRAYTRADAGEFRGQVLQLPFSHGKSRSNPLTGPEAVARNKALPTPQRTVTMKTAKRHFSALSQYWEWLEARGHVDQNIFHGFKFPGTKSNRKRRDDWSPEDMEKVFRHEPWYGPGADRESAYYWLPLIALHSGMRVEEIARLRPREDIQTIDGVPAIMIQPHPDGWNPKTEAGERVVPIHSRLAAFGFLDFVERRRQAGAARLFADLQPGGPDGKYSYTFSREFSRAKIHKMEVGAKTTFHSFRHSVRTLLTDTDAMLRDAWIDAVLGHDADDVRDQEHRRRQSEGIKTYLKRVGIQRLREVVEAIEPPIDLSRFLRPMA